MCEQFTEELKKYTEQEFDVKMKLLSDSLSERQDVIRLYGSELDCRMADLVIADKCVTQNFSRLNRAIALAEKQFRKDLENYYKISVSSLIADLEYKNTLVTRMKKVELFMQELKDKGSDCDLVQFYATLCARSENLLSAPFSDNDLDRLELSYKSFPTAPTDVSINDLFGELRINSSRAATRNCNSDFLLLEDVSPSISSMHEVNVFSCETSVTSASVMFSLVSKTTEHSIHSSSISKAEDDMFAEEMMPDTDNANNDTDKLKITLPTSADHLAIDVSKLNWLEEMHETNYAGIRPLTATVPVSFDATQSHRGIFNVWTWSSISYRLIIVQLITILT